MNLKATKSIPKKQLELPCSFKKSIFKGKIKKIFYTNNGNLNLIYDTGLKELFKNVPKYIFSSLKKCEFKEEFVMDYISKKYKKH